MQIHNRSPLILNGLALAGLEPADPKSMVPGVLSGLSVGPGKYLAIGGVARDRRAARAEEGRARPRRRPQRALRIRARTRTSGEMPESARIDGPAPASSIASPIGSMTADR